MPDEVIRNISERVRRAIKHLHRARVVIRGIVEDTTKGAEEEDGIEDFMLKSDKYLAEIFTLLDIAIKIAEESEKV